jgi:cytoskeletal protein CcmA (bactofilin family)
MNHASFKEESMLKKSSGTPEQAEITAFLGKGTEFKGVLSFEGTIRVDGKVEGEILSKDTLIAGDGAFLQGEISVGTLISSGKIKGNVTAGQKVHLLAPAAVQGTIKTPKLIIEEGVTFDGKSEMAGESQTPDQKAVPLADR